MTLTSKIKGALASAGCVLLGLLSLLPRRWALLTAVLSLLTGLLLFFPRHSAADDDRMFAHLAALMAHADANGTGFDSDSPLTPMRIPVMSFNMRFDGLESDPSNHFLQRLPRIARLFTRAQPWVAGLQEALSGQLVHTMSVLPARYRSVTYARPGNAPAQIWDAKVAIVYDSTKLQLMEQDYLWLSETPRVEGTDWPRDDPAMPFDPRCLNIARFRIKETQTAGSDSASTSAEPLELIHFNTHLSMRSESNRRRGSALAASVVREWRLRYPRALFVFTGDFNTAPGQTAHRTLTAPGMLTDSFSECAATAGCATSAVANSFHGWRGTQPNSFLWRAAQAALFTLYAGGIKIPHHMPHTAREVWRAVRDLWAELKSPAFPFAEAVPLWPFNRFHVDWILYAKGAQQGKEEGTRSEIAAASEADGWEQVDRPSDASASASHPPPSPSAAPSLRPLFSSLLDTRCSEYSSDHFPIVTLFEVSRSG